jgi:hypothetical protein
MTKEKTREQKSQDSSLNPESKITNLYSHGSGGVIDDEYYINELIGLDDFTYADWIGNKREEKKKDEYFTNSFGVRMKRQK